MVSLHFLSLMEALQECNSTVLARVSYNDFSYFYYKLMRWYFYMFLQSKKHTVKFV